ncbi:hypothetical protein [[Flexibacter] sp. ATCC 35208]|uniref:hypothetical protein n=1 Tax=[Flexibacter] sp. ATCC 35208 TaxID=1936242 RepID=UPI0009D587B1|nr:hypothetical protein [[Flexibacter] sp. ATCC 35208]OMP75068.1 hypothetical protein BW716_32040 [[Flexibacter] sp. ATCC 35208]
MPLLIRHAYGSTRKDTVIIPYYLYRVSTLRDTLPPRLYKPIADTIPIPLFKPKPPSRNWFHRVAEYRDSLRRRDYRDSLIRKMTRQNAPEPPTTDSSIIKSEKYFIPFTGRVIRDIYYRKVNVFGPQNIRDTAFTTSMKLIKLANRLHYNTEEWVIRQALFFKSGDTLNPYEMSDNERYLRSRPYMQDARLYIINAGASPDSLDLLVVTKDVFEYGVDVGEASTSAVRTTIYNNNLFGAGQELRVGAYWKNSYNPPWGSEVKYTKYNALGTFADVSLGYTTLNNYFPLDSGVFEGAYYLNINRPLYNSSADWAGGIGLRRSFSINAREQPDTIYRDYKYELLELWGGYNLIKQDKHNLNNQRPNLAILLAHSNQMFLKTPRQPIYKYDPIYNNHRYYLAQAIVFRNEFFKSTHFFGFGRTEDIPLGYNASVTSGWETWKGRTRAYAGIEGQKFWVTKLKGIFNAQIGIGTFYQNGRSEDAVIHTKLEYYSRSFRLGKGRFREFAYFDYLGNPNPYFYKPLQLNMEHGIYGYKGVPLTGYQRINLRSETVYYSPLKVLGFKFNWFTTLQATQLTINSNNVFKNPIYGGVGLGCRIKNENLPLNTLLFDINYFPNAPAPVKPVYFEITTTVDFRFDIFTLKMPNFINFR